MRGRNHIADEEWRAAAREVLRYELEQFDAMAAKPDHPFRQDVENKIDALRRAVNRGDVKAADYHMGWQYYTKNGIAAVLICFLLACATMPEVVLAGYQKLIEVVETIFEEYTEYRYRVNDDGGIEETFRPIKLNYLPEGMEEVRQRERINSLDLFYMRENGQSFKIYQKIVTKKITITYKIDTQDVQRELIKVQNETVELMSKEDRISFIWIHDGYYIEGQSSLSKAEVVEILNHIEF